MMITGCIFIDLTAVKEDRQRNRVGALADAPKGATVELIAGPLRVNPDTARLVRQFAEERDLTVCVKGTSYAVQSWVTALRSGELCGVLL